MLIIYYIRPFSKKVHELKSVKEEYEFMVENALDGICIVKDKKYLFVNKAFCEMFQYEENELIGKEYNIIFDEKDRENIDEHYSIHIWHNQEASNTYDTQALTKNGEIVDIEINVSRIKHHDGFVDLLFIRDIKDRIDLESKLLHSQKMESVGTLAGGIAHDFNNILTGIMGYSSVLLARIHKDNEMYKQVSEIHRSALIAAELTDQLLTFSEKSFTQFEVLDMNQTIRNGYTLICRSIGHMIEVKLDLDGNLSFLEGDGTLIQRILMTLCINARDAMPEGGNITIKTANVSFDNEFCKENLWAKPGDYIELTVEDIGEGIPEEIINRIFDPFFTTKTKEHGTGLGLAMVYGAVQKHKGFINVESEVGKGSKFKLYFPITDKELVVKEITKETHLNYKPTILIVDDEEIVREVAETILNEEGFRTLSAVNGEDGVNVYKEHHNEIDVVLLDLTMPKMDGNKAMKEMKKIDKNVKIILSSGYSMDATIRELINNGEAIFVQKPYQIEDLIHTIQKIAC